jgi:hypothetical protein
LQPWQVLRRLWWNVLFFCSLLVQVLTVDLVCIGLCHFLGALISLLHCVVMAFVMHVGEISVFHKGFLMPSWLLQLWGGNQNVQRINGIHKCH